MTDLGLDALAAEHRRADYTPGPCDSCGDLWPCPTHRLIAEARRAQALRTWLKKWQREARRARELEARVAETRAAIKNAMSAWYVEEARSALQADLDRYPEEES